MERKTAGFSAFTLKVIALALMTVDHIGCFIPGTPYLLRMLGRISAPVFLFTAAVSFRQTSNRARYILRLYIASLVMELSKMTIAFFDAGSRVYVTNNIFSTIFYAVLLAAGIEGAIRSHKDRNMPDFLRYSAIFALPVVWTLITSLRGGAPDFWPLRAAAPTLTQVEGGVIWTFIGVGFCLLSANKKRLISFYAAFCAIEILGVILFAGLPSLLIEIQWMMVFALPLMLLYNGKKGPGLKWLFYAYYPLHIWGLYFLGMYVFGRN